MLLEAKGLYKEYDKNVIINNLNLKINKGEFVSIMGKSGSGKSTLLYLISGMAKPTSGEVKFLDNDLFSLKDEQLSKLRLEKMGFVFQKPNFLKSLTIKDNIILPALQLNKKSKKEIIAYCNLLFEQMDISHIKDSDITKTSGGELQRATIARALINEAEVIFSDEPTGALNSGAKEAVMNILSNLNGEGKTIILVTHDKLVALRSKRILFLKDGNIIDELYLDKYQKDNEKERIFKLNEFLLENEF